MGFNSSLELIFDTTGRPLLYKFNGSMYVGEMYIYSSHDKNNPTIQNSLLKSINKQMHTGESFTNLDSEILVKVEQTLFTVSGDKSTAHNSIEIPKSEFDKLSIRSPPSPESVFVLEK